MNPSPNSAHLPAPIIASIWAQDRHRIIGSGTGMLWRVPDDFRHFRSMTMGCPIIMGRHSWEGLFGALPGRDSIVVTSRETVDKNGALVTHSLDEALRDAHLIAEATDAPYIWITGGGRLYADTMDVVDELVVTDLNLDVSRGEDVKTFVRAPLIDEDVWQRDPARSDSQWREKSGDAHWKITTWVRRDR